MLHTGQPSHQADPLQKCLALPNSLPAMAVHHHSHKARQHHAQTGKQMGNPSQAPCYLQSRSFWACLSSACSYSCSNNMYKGSSKSRYTNNSNSSSSCRLICGSSACNHSCTYSSITSITNSSSRARGRARGRGRVPGCRPGRVIAPWQDTLPCKWLHTGHHMLKHLRLIWQHSCSMFSYQAGAVLWSSHAVCHAVDASIKSCSCDHV